ncbi:MAG: hypothetical protein PVF73_02265, partial [Bacteroidales bacterium]
MKWLAGIFIVLLLLTVLVVIKNNSRTAVNRNRTFNSQLTDFDTSEVSKIIIIPRASGNRIELNKPDGHWEITIKDNHFRADRATIRSMISGLSTLTAKRIAGKDKAHWSEYEVADSTATRVQFHTDKK